MSGPTWFTRPDSDDPATGRMNAAYDAADRNVVVGRADDPALRSGGQVWSFARLVQDLASIGGLMRALGVGMGDAVAIATPVRVEAALVALAAARIGAVTWTADDLVSLVPRSRARVVLTSGALLGDVAAASADLGAAQQARMVLDADGVTLDEERDVPWAIGLKAGATDPAGVSDVRADAAVWTVLEDATPVVRTHHEVLTGPPDVPGGGWTAGGLDRLYARLAAGETVEVSG